MTLGSDDRSPERLLALPALAKLNLFLHVTGRRADGYHDLQTVFRYIDLADKIDLTRRADGAVIRTEGLATTLPDDDLAVRAARALQCASGSTFGVEIAVRKRIPVGGGLGGGSSDAATVLIGLNRLWGLEFSRERLAQIGLPLGADVPAFIFGRTAFGEGVGEQLQPIDLPPRRYLVVWPGIAVSTAQIFSNARLTRNTPPVKLRGSFESASIANGQFGRNDLEPIAASLFEPVRRALDWIAAFGTPRMSGSGSCCYVALTDASMQLPTPPAPMHAWVARAVDRHPLSAWLDPLTRPL